LKGGEKMTDLLSLSIKYNAVMTVEVLKSVHDIDVRFNHLELLNFHQTLMKHTDTKEFNVFKDYFYQEVDFISDITPLEELKYNFLVFLAEGIVVSNSHREYVELLFK
jgi:hypothetical protein